MVVAVTKRGKEAQDRVLAAILSLTVERGYPPTYREIGTHVKLAHSAVYLHVHSLSEAGLVYEDHHTARSLRLSDAGRAHVAATEYPDRIEAAI